MKQDIQKNRRSESREEYLETLFHLCGGPDGATTISSVAEDLGVSPASVSQMMSRLAKDGAIERDKDGQIRLTVSGWADAVRLVRRHRLSERFLTDYLELPWDQVHEEACKLEHALSDEVEAGLAERLGNPRTCPHGRVIPTADGEIAKEADQKLAEVSAGQKCVISFVSDEQPELLRYLASLGLLPETPVCVEEVAPFNGPLLVRVGRARYALGRDVARKVFVRWPE
ncbi:MAG: metal-dependent transcriptional regulator [Actinobacteria bacterium]|nr:metal-dependent transcriptional regulator [Actinomycetota bacterium]